MAAEAFSLGCTTPTMVMVSLLATSSCRKALSSDLSTQVLWASSYW